MKRFASIIKLKSEAYKEEYKRRHDNIWPELSDLISRRGIRNYSIWYFDKYLFLYYETDEDGVKPLLAKEDIELSEKWEEYMSDIIDHVEDANTGGDITLERMFLHI